MPMEQPGRPSLLVLFVFNLSCSTKLVSMVCQITVIPIANGTSSSALFTESRWMLYKTSATFLLRFCIRQSALLRLAPPKGVQRIATSSLNHLQGYTADGATSEMKWRMPAFQHP
eukprot:gnl/MRDRNA2_/MRDRNA2_13533_c0_seq1.p1 gnl/MRDRNA2_/MRDRNA2_13533_c0~~gnl/MRDRNA2_/MRDRNA2_13533_c0_seq1.p1  ORF type:complete len:115 (-),score=9.43 gnl/MRDRNA2_/MRDRNA2_13533_c0_seq1:58-402(-)